MQVWTEHPILCYHLLVSISTYLDRSLFSNLHLHHRSILRKFQAPCCGICYIILPGADYFFCMVHTSSPKNRSTRPCLSNLIDEQYFHLNQAMTIQVPVDPV